MEVHAAPTGAARPLALDRAALPGWRRSALLVGVRALLARPRAGEVMPADRAVAVDDHARGLEDYALDGGRAQDLDPARLLRPRLGRVLVVDLRPHEVEDPLADEAAEDAEDDPEGLVDQLHRAGGYRCRRRG